jgi:hypothetical protein
VTNELVFYVAIACGVSLTLRRSIVWLAVSVVITAGTFAYLSLTNLDALLVQLYYSLWCGTLPFALGAVAFHTRHRIPPLSLGSLIAAVTIIGVSIEWSSVSYNSKRYDLAATGIYAALLCHAVIVIYLDQVKANVSRAWLITDDIIGRFSYPIYLLQLLSFGILTDHGMSSALSPAIGLKVLLGTIAIAACGLVVVDAPIQLVRKLVRGNVQTRHAPLLPTDRAVPVVIPAITAPKSLM